LLIKANSISTTAMVITQITTYAITGVALAEFGAQKIMLTSALLYIPAVVLVLAISTGESAKKGKIESFKHIVDDLSEGFKFMLSEGQIKFVTRRVFFMMVAVMVFYISLTGGALEHMLSSGGIKLKTIGALGFMQAMLGLGLVAGVMITGKLIKIINEKSIIKYSFPVFGILIIGLYFLNNYYFLLACAFFGGMAGVMVLSIAETVLQKETPENMRGRIFSAYYVFRNTGPLAAAGIAGLLIRFMSEEKVMLLSGISLAAYGLVNLMTGIKKKKALKN
jgi:DHA3 family macrolide efflux protein-like MFS transporter